MSQKYKYRDMEWLKFLDGHWGDGTMVCRCCGSRQATTHAPDGAELCASCDKYLREMMKRQQKHSVWKRMLDRVMRKLTGDDG